MNFAQPRFHDFQVVFANKDGSFDASKRLRYRIFPPLVLKLILEGSFELVDRGALLFAELVTDTERLDVAPVFARAPAL